MASASPPSVGVDQVQTIPITAADDVGIVKFILLEALYTFPNGLDVVKRIDDSRQQKSTRVLISMYCRTAE